MQQMSSLSFSFCRNEILKKKLKSGLNLPFGTIGPKRAQRAPNIRILLKKGTKSFLQA